MASELRPTADPCMQALAMLFTRTNEIIARGRTDTRYLTELNPQAQERVRTGCKSKRY